MVNNEALTGTADKLSTSNIPMKGSDVLKANSQLDQVHLACRTQLLLPGLVAVVHHVHVHHVTWECHI